MIKLEIIHQLDLFENWNLRADIINLSSTIHFRSNIKKLPEYCKLQHSIIVTRERITTRKGSDDYNRTESEKTPRAMEIRPKRIYVAIVSEAPRRFESPGFGPLSATKKRMKGTQERVRSGLWTVYGFQTTHYILCLYSPAHYHGITDN